MPELRAAVIGAGRLGTLHARKYAAIPGVTVAHVVDIDRDRAAQVAAEVGASPLTDYRELAGAVDLVTVASPGITHHEIASAMLSSGIDVLLEKPMATTLAEARQLADLASSGGRILQIGHLERFNPAVVRLHSLVKNPRFVECHRLAPFTERGTDVDVVLDLMVHDLDVIMSVAPSEVASLEAVGVAILTDRIDLANARIRFRSGLIANLVTSRVSARRERKIRFFQPDAYISVDYEARRIQIYRKSPPSPGSNFPTISAEQIDLAESDPLADEVRSFVDAVRTRATPAVSADDGLRVMELSERIKEVMLTEAAAS
ncbi:MAG: Gfo/Idh/MocA family oxidoreductase [Candidatus Binatus sp.]|uniref:Gfo/Idh/MocA family protein n=1 Tax=Candidatus Binatus sp. TaxID=2811406 RepID=UPI0027170D27|nr:Gfo/Idh/MocA family oxidoreductase [Candidatus Binatus sp.]MDO8432013.1 Gfo/Idh/MocA family oxidoreductase [Candidatus Binatus sp.]